MRAISSGHTDGYVLCAPQGVVLMEACTPSSLEIQRSNCTPLSALPTSMVEPMVMVRM